MALNSTIKTLSINANCDLSRYNQAIKDYNGFKRCNSFYMNNRLSHWYSSGRTDTNIIKNVYWRVNTSDSSLFDIYSRDETTKAETAITSISRQGFSLESVEITDSLKQTISKISNPFTEPVYIPCNSDFEISYAVTGGMPISYVRQREREAENIQKLTFENVSIYSNSPLCDITIYHTIGANTLKFEVRKHSDSTLIDKSTITIGNTNYDGLIGAIYFQDSKEGSRLPSYSFLITSYSGSIAESPIYQKDSEGYSKDLSGREVTLDSRNLKYPLPIYYTNQTYPDTTDYLTQCFQLFKSSSGGVNIAPVSITSSLCSEFGPQTDDDNTLRIRINSITVMPDGSTSGSTTVSSKDLFSDYVAKCKIYAPHAGTSEYLYYISALVPPMCNDIFSDDGVKLWFVITPYDITATGANPYLYSVTYKPDNEELVRSHGDSYFESLSTVEDSTYSSDPASWGYTVTSYNNTYKSKKDTDYEYTSDVKWDGVIYPVNYICPVSEKINDFFINYIGNVANCITYKDIKLISVSDDDSIIGSDGTYVYFYVNNNAYRLGITTFDAPVCSIADNQYCVFNSISGKAIDITRSNAVIYTSNSWQNFLVSMTTEYSAYWTQMASAYGNSVDSFYNSKIMSAASPATNFNNVVTASIGTISTSKTKFGILIFDTEVNQFSSVNDNDIVVYLPENVVTSSTPSLIKYGTYNIGTKTFTSSYNGSIVYSATSDIYPVQLLNSYFMIDSSYCYSIENNNSYQLNKNTDKLLTLLHSLSETSFVTSGSIIFTINNSQYAYNSNDGKLLFLYSNNSESVTKTICRVSLFKFIGYTTRYAYFYCVMDKGLYVFKGDATFERIAYIEDETPVFATVSDDVITSSKVDGIDSKYLPNVDMLVINLTNKVGILYGEQFCMLDANTTITNLDVDSTYGLIKINDKQYSLVSDYYFNNDYDAVPIVVETEFFGDPNGLKNTVNDCVYITVYNSLGVSSGTVEVSSLTIQNNIIKESKEKTITLSSKDFNGNNVALIKYQPQYMEALGFKVKIKSDFEIADIKIGTTQTVTEQTKLRV